MKIASMLNDVFASLFKRPFTELYPYAVKPAPPNLRGKLLCDESKCDGCKLCGRDCPAKAIEVELVDRATKKVASSARAPRRRCARARCLGLRGLSRRSDAGGTRPRPTT